MNKPVDREQRWTKHSPCPVCSGDESMPRGMSKGRFDKAKRELCDRGSIQSVSLKSGQRKRATVFGPSEAVRPTRWPAQPTAEEWFKS
jgi:hypothetical protein